MQNFKTVIKRGPARSLEESAKIREILRAGRVVHVGFVDDSLPYVIPMFYGITDEGLILHGSKASRVMNKLKAGDAACLSVVLEDGLVYAKAAFSHSMNYRSVMVFGSGRVLQTRSEKLQAAAAIIEHMTPGRWDDCRQPDAAELAATLFIQFGFEQMTAKVRTGGPRDKPEDHAFECWAGHLPLESKVGLPIAADYNQHLVPGYL